MTRLTPRGPTLTDEQPSPGIDPVHPFHHGPQLSPILGPKQFQFREEKIHFPGNLDLDVSPISIQDKRGQKAVNFNPNYHHRNIILGSI